MNFLMRRIFTLANRSLMMKEHFNAQMKTVNSFHSYQILYNRRKKPANDIALSYFNRAERKEKEVFLEIIRIYVKENAQLRNHIQFILKALKCMDDFGVNRDLETYKALLDIFPKGKYIPENIYQAMLHHYPKQQDTAIKLLIKMEDNYVMPDYEMQEMILNIFGVRSLVIKRFWRMMYWMPKFVHLNPWPVPEPPPTDPRELAHIAMHKLSNIDFQAKVTEFRTKDVPDAIDDTWIMSTMSSSQQELLAVQPTDKPLTIEGPFMIWVGRSCLDYFVLKGDPIKRDIVYVDYDDISNVKIPFWEKHNFGIPVTIHEQDDDKFKNISAIYSRRMILQNKTFVHNARNYLRMPNCKHVPSTYMGKSYEEVKRAHESIVSPSLKPFYKEPLIIYEGRGQWLWDHRGERYLDMFGGVATVSVGHSHPKIVAAISEQASKLNHVSSVYMQPRLHEYVTKLISKFSGKLKVAYLTNSGSEANELAFLMARLYTRSQNIVSLKNGYHGATYGTSASTALSNWKYPFIAQPAGYMHMVYPDVYKGNWGGSKCRDSPVQVTAKNCDCGEQECLASEKYFSDFKEVFCYSLPSKQSIAAFVAESIQGIGGTVQYPKYFLKKVYDYIHEKGGLCIADEVQTGFGRTGEHFWGFESHCVEPDIVTLAKGIGNGFPLGAVITSNEIAESLNTALHFNTFGGNPLACAVGITVLDWYFRLLKKNVFKRMHI
nr:PREDICTED: uncharacterized protein LOC100880478 isoform X3 [Megachile rotundata]